MHNPGSTQAQNKGSVLAHPNIHPICDLLEHSGQEGCPLEPELQDLSCTRQQHNVQEESQ